MMLTLDLCLLSEKLRLTKEKSERRLGILGIKSKQISVIYQYLFELSKIAPPLLG